MSVQLVERALTLVETRLRTNIQGALDDVSAAFPDGIGSMRAPYDYFWYEAAIPQQLPAVYLLADQIDFRLPSKGANHISALIRARCIVVVEGVDLQDTTQKGFRYHNAFHQVLNGAELDYNVSGQQIVRDIVKVASSDLGSIFQDKDSPGSMFKKEIGLNLEIEHYENFS